MNEKRYSDVPVLTRDVCVIGTLYYYIYEISAETLKFTNYSGEKFTFLSLYHSYVNCAKNK